MKQKGENRRDNRQKRRPEHENLTATQEKYLLALYRLQITGVSQVEVAHELGVTEASTSKTIRELITLGLVERKKSCGISLTVEGNLLAERLDDRYTTIMRYLMDGLDMDEDRAEQEALDITMQMSPEFSASFLRKIEQNTVRYPINYKDNCQLSKVLKDGVYEVPFQLLRLKEDRISMGDKGFLHPAVLELKDGVATVQLKLTELSCRSVVGRMLTGKLTQLRYYTESGYQEAQITEDLCNITLEQMELQLDTHGNPRGGCLPVKVRTSVGVGAMPESNARLIFNFRAMKKNR